MATLPEITITKLMILKGIWHVSKGLEIKIEAFGLVLKVPHPIQYLMFLWIFTATRLTEEHREMMRD